jgi:hypothetical protein
LLSGAESREGSLLAAVPTKLFFLFSLLELKPIKLVFFLVNFLSCARRATWESAPVVYEFLVLFGI